MSRIDINIPQCDGSEYVLFPACAYNGNKFNVLKRDYPPMYKPEEASVDMEITITDVPRLEKDGLGKIEVTTGDVSVPCVCVYNKKTNKAFFVYTIQEIDGKNIGLAYEMGKISLTYPAYREKVYRWPHMVENKEEYADINIEIPHKVIEADCNSMEEFYQIYFNNRKIMGLDDTRPDVLSDKEQFEIQKNKFNSMNWTGEFYDIDALGQWQPGWCSGGIAGYPLMKLGGKLEYERSVKTLEFMYDNQSPSGFFYGFANRKDDGLNMPGTEKWVFIRKSADALYFSFKHFELMEGITKKMYDGAKKLADRFVWIWEKYGQFGQFHNYETGEIVVGNSTAGAIVSAALVKAYEFFKDDKYLEIAKESAEAMYKKDALNGYTTGGPGEILQCPDSESAAALLESLTLLYEKTGEKKWLDYSVYMTNFVSSWVVSYNYKFPKESEFGKLGMKTVGSVFANAQNKHSAPGICTLSGTSIYKVYKWTKNEKYKELYKDVALTVSQYMSTEKRPIYSWDVPKDASLLNDDSIRVPCEKLPEGFICERVNMSDWESKRCIGGVFNGSCWCETTNLLILAEKPEDI